MYADWWCWRVYGGMDAVPVNAFSDEEDEKRQFAEESDTATEHESSADESSDEGKCISTHPVNAVGSYSVLVIPPLFLPIALSKNAKDRFKRALPRRKQTVIDLTVDSAARDRPQRAAAATARESE